MQWSAGQAAGWDGLPLFPTPAGLRPTHLAELDLHEDVVLPPAAPLCTPGVLGPGVGARATGRGPPGACEADSCPGKRDRGQADSGEPLSLGPSPQSRPFSLGQEILSWEMDRPRKEEELRPVRRGSGSRLPAAQGQGWTPAQAPSPGWGGPVVAAALTRSPPHLWPGWGPKSRPP